MSQSFEDVKNWLFNSDLVINDENNKNCGAVHSYFDESQNKFGFLYPEITGYFLSILTCFSVSISSVISFTY